MMRRAGPGISSAFTPRATPTTSWTSWSGSSPACRPKRRMHCSSSLALETAAEITTLSIVLGTSGGAGRRGRCGRRVRQELIERIGRRLPVRPRPGSGGRLFADPGELRAEAHLRIGRLLAAHTPPEKREEAIFEIVNQLQPRRSLDHLAGRARAARRAQSDRGQSAPRLRRPMPRRSTISLPVRRCWPDDCWERRHELIFALELHRAECEFLTGALADAEERLTASGRRTPRMPVEHAAVACLRLDLYHDTRSERPRGRASVSTISGISASTGRPIRQKRKRGANIERIWSQLGEPRDRGADRPALDDDPRPRDPGCSDQRSCRLHCSPMRTLLARGSAGRSISASSTATATVRASPMSVLGIIAGPRFGDYRDRISTSASSAIELVEQRGLDALPGPDLSELRKSRPALDETCPACPRSGASRFRIAHGRSATSLSRRTVAASLNHEPSRGGRSARRGATRSRARPRVCAEGAIRSRRSTSSRRSSG